MAVALLGDLAAKHTVNAVLVAVLCPTVSMVVIGLVVIRHDLGVVATVTGPAVDSVSPALLAHVGQVLDGEREAVDVDGELADGVCHPKVLKVGGVSVCLAALLVAFREVGC